MSGKKQFYKLCPGYTYVPTEYPPVKRIVVFGDLHGDYNLVVKLLKFAGLAEFRTNYVKWTGSDTYVVQLGDQIDLSRGKKIEDDEDSDVKIMLLFNNLHEQATLCGGAVISLLGNHELMNIMGNMTYVSEKGKNDFRYNEYAGESGRIEAFKPGNDLAKMMACTRLPAVIIGNFIFIHGGLIDSNMEKNGITCREDLEKIANLLRQWMLNKLSQDKVKKYLFDTDSIFWERYLGTLPSQLDIDDEKCVNSTSNVFKLLKVGHIIIGHTPQRTPNKTCGDGVWRIDTAPSKGFRELDRINGNSSRYLSYLEILYNKQIEVREKKIN